MAGFFNTLPSVLDQGMIWGIMAIGVFITFRILNFADLTVDGSFATGGCVFAVLVAGNMPVALAFFIAFLAGALAGLITAIFHCYLGIPGILAGILTQLMLWSINYKVLGQATLPIKSRDAYISMNASLGVYTTIPIVLGIAIGLILLLYWFFGTKYGSSIRATGANESMARTNGININFRKIIALMISNGIVAFAGAILARFQGSADINMGRGAIVIGLAAIVIGTTLFGRLSKNFGVTQGFVLVGAIIYFFVFQLIVYVTNEPELLKILSAIVVAIFLAVPYIKDVYIKNMMSKHNRAKELE